LARRVALRAALPALAMAAAGCGGASPAPPVARLGTTTSAAATSASKPETTVSADGTLTTA